MVYTSAILEVQPKGDKMAKKIKLGETEFNFVTMKATADNFTGRGLPKELESALGWMRLLQKIKKGENPLNLGIGYENGCFYFDGKNLSSSQLRIWVAHTLLKEKGETLVPFEFGGKKIASFKE